MLDNFDGGGGESDNEDLVCVIGCIHSNKSRLSNERTNVQLERIKKKKEQRTNRAS